jgi:hypothetical protein
MMFKNKRIRDLEREVVFWKFAFAKASDEAFFEFEELRHAAELMIMEGDIDAASMQYCFLGAKRLSELGCYEQTADEDKNSFYRSAERRYTEVIDYILKQCQLLGFDWVTRNDRSNIVLLKRDLD